jgi:AcrR family transcriptional regulator
LDELVSSAPFLVQFVYNRLKRLFETSRESALATVPSAKSSQSLKPSVEEPRERILSAAGQEFAERGYEAATVRDICLAAGVNVAAVNYYFGDKRRLYIESVKHAHRERVAQVPLPEWPPGRPAAERLHDFVDNLLERMLGCTQPPWQVRLMLREILHPTDACREMVEDYMRPHFALLVSILDELCRGRLPQPELRRVAMSIIGQCFLYRAAGDVVGMLVPRAEIDTLHTPKQLADHVTRFSLAALGAAAPLPETPRFERESSA